MATEKTTDGGELEFFGVKLKVKNERLAALLNSSVGEDVQVISRRAREVFGGDDGGAERAVAERLQRAGDSVVIKRDETEEA